MKVFKFGGASIKNAEGVKNILSVLKMSEEKDLIVVVNPGKIFKRTSNFCASS